MQKQEIADARRDLDPERGDFLREPGEPSLVMGDRLFDMVVIRERRDPRRDRRRHWC